MLRACPYLLVLWKQVRDLARIEHVVEVLKHGLHHDLGVGEQEGNVLALHARLDLIKRTAQEKGTTRVMVTLADVSGAVPLFDERRIPAW